MVPTHTHTRAGAAHQPQTTHTAQRPRVPVDTAGLGAGRRTLHLHAPVNTHTVHTTHTRDVHSHMHSELTSWWVV